MPTDSSTHNWFIKYKLYHIPFWFAYHYLWWTVAIGSAWQAMNSILFSDYSIKYCSYVIVQAIGVYFNLYFLIPRFLEKGRYAEYIGLLLITIFLTAVLIIPGYYAGAWWAGRDFREMYGTDPSNYAYFFQINTFPSTVAAMTLAMSIKLTKNYIQSKRREQLLEKEKLETELKFLKSQFNPHFLFNTINSIFVLIHKNQDMASESLAKFSDLLRYQLYECNEQQIPLEKELTYLENFIELEKLRQDRDNLDLTLQIDQPYAGERTIAPFILMPFIENAFKHVSQHRHQLNWVKMKLHFDQHLLHFTISNSTSTHHNSSHEFNHHSGIGLKNVQRRLDLLYPGKHRLNIVQDEIQFSVTLQLGLQMQKINELADVTL